MAVLLTFPRFDYLDADGTITVWLKSEGDQVQKGDPLYETESQKAVRQVTATGSGYLGILAPVGSAVTAGDTIGVLAASKEELETALAEHRQKSKAAATPAETAGPSGGQTEPAERRVSARAKLLAQKLGVDLAAVEGTGPQGRIMPEDVQRAAEQGKTGAAGTDGRKVAQTIPLRGIRKTIAQRLVSSLQLAAQVTNTTDADATDFVKARERLAAESERLAGVRITYNDLLVAACAKALRESPMMNSSIIGDEIKVWDDVNIGVAVNTEDGLLVPVIRQADQKSLIDIHNVLTDLIQKCQNHTVGTQEMIGGTFTISNASRLGIDYSTAVINPPESGILCIGRFMDRPWVVDGAIAVRTVVGLSITFDHRVVDGVYASAFLTRIAELIQKPDPLIEAFASASGATGGV